MVKTSKTRRPAKSCRETSPPETQGRVKSGAFLPGLRPPRPVRLGVVASSCSSRQRSSPRARNAPRSKKPRNSTTSHRAMYETNHQGFIVCTSIGEKGLLPTVRGGQVLGTSADPSQIIHELSQGQPIVEVGKS